MPEQIIEMRFVGYQRYVVTRGPMTPGMHNGNIQMTIGIELAGTTFYVTVLRPQRRCW
jgi:hypothetical protein